MKAHLINWNSAVIRASAVAFVIAAALLALSSTPAHAYTTPGSGSPGVVSFAPTINARHYYPSMPSLVFGATVVYLSPADPGVQTVTATYGVWTRTASRWELNRVSTRSLRLSPGYYGTFAAINFSPLYHMVGYRAMITIVWKNASGVALGTRTIDYNATTDYRCFTTDVAKCTAYDNQDGWGAFVAFWI